MAQRDYYELLGVARDAAEARDQEGLPAARAQAPSRPEPRRRPGRGAVQGDQRGLRGPLGSRTAAPSTTATAAWTCRRAGWTSAGWRTCSAISSRGSSAAGAAGRRRPRRARATTSATTSRSRSRRRRTGSRRGSRSRGSRPARPAAGAGPSPGRGGPSARRARDAASCATSRASSPSPGRAPSAAARARSSRIPARPARARAASQQERTLKVRIPPGVDEGAQMRITGEGEGGVGGGPPGDLYVVLHVQRASLLHAAGQRALLRAPAHLRPGGARGRGRRADPERRRAAQGAGRHAERRRAAAPREGDARASTGAAAATRATAWWSRSRGSSPRGSGSSSRSTSASPPARSRAPSSAASWSRSRSSSAAEPKPPCNSAYFRRVVSGCYRFATTWRRVTRSELVKTVQRPPIGHRRPLVIERSTITHICSGLSALAATKEGARADRAPIGSGQTFSAYENQRY